MRHLFGVLIAALLAGCATPTESAGAPGWPLTQADLAPFPGMPPVPQVVPLPPPVSAPPAPVVDLSGAYDFTSGLLGKRPRLAADATAPVFPEQSVARAETGNALVRHCVTAEGVPASIQLIEGTGSKRLDDASIKWVKASPYQPGEIDGTPVDVCGVLTTVRWVLVPGSRQTGAMPLVRGATLRQ